MREKLKITFFFKYCGTIFSLLIVRNKFSIFMNLNLLTMLRWTISFFIAALVAAIFLFGNITESATIIAKPLYYIFISLCILSVILEEKTDQQKFTHLF